MEANDLLQFLTRIERQLDAIDQRLERLDGRLRKIEVEVAKLTVKAGVWGFIAGAVPGIPAIVFLLMKYLVSE